MSIPRRHQSQYDNHNFAYGTFPNGSEVDAGQMVTPIESQGRTYYKTGKFCIQTLVGVVFKTFDKETKATRYMLQVGLAKQNQCDLRHDKTVAHDEAFQHAYTDPVMTILLDHRPDFYEFRDDAEGMIAEAMEIVKIHPNMVVKIPMTGEGLKAVKVLTAEGIKTNVTLIFNANQALLAARAGATYVSPFLGRLDDISTRGVDLISEIAQIFEVAGIDTEIIAASVRNPIHVTDCALAGADIATVPYKVIEQMTHHPLTDAGIEKFQADYKAVFGE